MGGRGSAGTSVKSNTARMEAKERSVKLPASGGKVQSAYIDYVRKQLNIDLSKARDTQFDDRNGFNIDTRKLTPSQYREIKSLAARYPGGYEVQFMSNGANRTYIRVRRKTK